MVVQGVGEIADTFFIINADTLCCKVSSLQITFLGLPLGSTVKSVCYFYYINRLAYLFVSFVTMPWSVAGGVDIPKRTFFVGSLLVLFSSWRFRS